ncbi:uncharacterized protein [Spinacia oleracea]|uniref:MULE transposase domain-containing protein n=1 Tax=Spinacia oleracea TaxID=3562 RepID=A0ABM3QWV7_SPIOL|nr:uncharacterized protein LOC110778149 [Spinacia oleracea]
MLGPRALFPSVSRSLSGLIESGKVVGETDEADSDEEGDGGGLDVTDDQELNDSDGEVVSVIGSYDEGPNYLVFNPPVNFKGSVELWKGLKFPSNIVLRKSIRFNAIQKGYNYYYLHNIKQRLSIYCANRCKCPWKKARIVSCSCKQKRKCRFKLHARKLKGEDSWQIKSIRAEHICGWQYDNPKVTSKYLAERYLDDWMDEPNTKVKALIKRARRKVKSEIGYYKACRAKKLALKMIFGDAILEYARVWDYAAAIRKYNPGSTAVVKVQGIENPPPLFQRLNICLQACKEGFMGGCGPIIGVDGAHLRGSYTGILLTAVGKDGNNNIFPVAWAVVETENAETWSWFLKLLRSDIISVADVVTWVHEKEDEGLLDAFRTVMPNAETRYCCRHIWTNFKSKFPGVLYKEHFWKAARSSTKHYFNTHMETIKELNVEAFKYLEDIKTSHWSRHGFSTASKSGMLLNNCCESFNNVLREAREKPIL